MVSVNGHNVDLVHIRYEGTSHDVYTNDLSLGGETSQAEFFTAVEDNLDLNQGALSGYELDIVAATKTAIIRPQAKFGV